MSEAAQHMLQWDDFDIYLFDIDGTLLNCADAVHYFAFCKALKQLSGRDLNLDGVITHGNVDNGILRDALLRNGVPEAEWRPQLGQAHATMCGYVEQHAPEFRIDVLPGVEALLQHLRSRGAKLGTATGNLQSIGEAKLRHCGLLQYFDFGGWSDRWETRQAVFAAAITDARQRFGIDSTLCVIGDTLADVSAAHANGLPAIAVATGSHTMETLREAGADLAVPTLEVLLGSSVRLQAGC